MTEFKREQARYRRLARKALALLPKARIARTGEPSWMLNITFDPANRTQATNAMHDLAAAVRLKRHRRRYFHLPTDYYIGIEHAIAVSDKGRTLRLMRFFDMSQGKMITRLDVAGA